MNNRPKRKQNRLKDFDYNQTGAYFITICAKNHAELFGNVIADEVPKVELSPIGKIVESEITKLSSTYSNVGVDHNIIMPNHIHMIIVIREDNSHNTAAPVISQMINQWKRAVSIKAGCSPWQKSFHDHVIRNEADYRRIAEYIANNPATWENDCHYVHPPAF